MGFVDEMALIIRNLLVMDTETTCYQLVNIYHLRWESWILLVSGVVRKASLNAVD